MTNKELAKLYRSKYPISELIVEIESKIDKDNLTKFRYFTHNKILDIIEKTYLEALNSKQININKSIDIIKKLEYEINELKNIIK